MNKACTPITPERFDAVLFDLDGVLTSTARIHARCWKLVFDEFLARRAPDKRESREPFDMDIDYKRHVDGKPRYDGVRAFLASRNISLPEGTPADPPKADTVCGLGNRKDELLKAAIDHGEVGLARAVVQTLFRTDPFDERAHGQLMRALYAVGRQADALATYRRLQRQLGEELGVDPSPDVQRLHELILRQDADLARPVGSGSRWAGQGRVPTHRRDGSDPAPLVDTAAGSLLGRDDDVAAVAGLVTTSPVVSLTGPGGAVLGGRDARAPSHASSSPACVRDGARSTVTPSMRLDDSVLSTSANSRSAFKI